MHYPGPRRFIPVVALVLIVLAVTWYYTRAFLRRPGVRKVKRMRL